MCTFNRNDDPCIKHLSVFVLKMHAVSERWRIYCTVWPIKDAGCANARILACCQVDKNSLVGRWKTSVSSWTRKHLPLFGVVLSHRLLKVNPYFECCWNYVQNSQCYVQRAVTNTEQIVTQHILACRLHKSFFYSMTQIQNFFDTLLFSIFLLTRMVLKFDLVLSIGQNTTPNECSR